MRELLMSKIIMDFKLRFQLVSGVTSSASARKLTHDLLPFLIEMHANLPNRLTRALSLQIEKVTSQLQTSSLKASSGDLKSIRQLGGFLVMEKDP